MTKGIVLARTKGIFQFVSSPKHNNDRDMYMDEALNPQRSSVPSKRLGTGTWLLCPWILSLERLMGYIARGGWVVRQLGHGAEVTLHEILHAISVHQLRLLHLNAKHLSLSQGQLHLELRHLMLEVRDGSDATINWIPHPCVCFVDQAAHCIRSLMKRKLL